MLKKLSIQDLVLVQKADLDFELGFIAITGETGSGKTVLVEALRLLSGERADTSKVRRGATKARISASFEGDFPKQLQLLLEESGVEFDQGEPLIISREVFKEGKSRCFVCSQPVTLTLLTKIASYLVDIVDQHAQLLLKKPHVQRDLLDQFAEIDLSSFQDYLKQEKKLRETLEKEREKQKHLDPQWLRYRYEELEKLAYKPGEEDILFSEISLLSSSEEIQLHATAVTDLSNEALTICHTISTHLSKLPLEEASHLTKEVTLQLTEISSLSTSLNARVESNPGRLNYVENRLSAIENAKKRFGTNLCEVKESLRLQLDDLEYIDERIFETETALRTVCMKTNEAATQISKKRKEYAQVLEKLLSEKLKQLNIEDAKVSISIDSSTRTALGDDLVIYHLQANQGEKSATVKDSSSGGEIARLLFCLKLILSEKGAAATIVFDEIDAGVGGETATLMGSQLNKLSKNGQIVSVTHFPQVARFADHHICVSKSTNCGRTESKIGFLSRESRELEFIRMLGGAQMTTVAANYDERIP